MALTISVAEIVEGSKSPLLGKRDSWGRVLLGDIAVIQNGFPFKSEQFTSDEGKPLIRIRDVGADKSNTYYVGGYDPAYVVNPGDLLIGMDGDFNCARWRGPAGLLNQRVCRIVFKSDVYHPKLLDYALPGYLKAINDKTSSVTVKHLSSKTIADIPLPLPPKEEQLEIVAEIEKQFSRLDEAVANLKRVKANLKRYKAAVLKAAVEGRLLATPCEYDSEPLRNLIGHIHQGWSPKCDLNREPGPDEWAVITTTAVQPMRYLDGQGKPLPHDLEPRPHLEVKVGDFLMTRKGPRIRAGVACLVRGTRHRLMVCDTVYRFRCDESKITPEYLEIALNAPSIVHAIDRQKAGINESGVSLTHSKLGGIEIPVPTLGDQSKIVDEVDRRLSLLSEIEAQVVANLRRGERLRQSVLGSAFSGGLVTGVTEQVLA